MGEMLRDFRGSSQIGISIMFELKGNCDNDTIVYQ